MSYKPGDAYYSEFTTANASTGAAQDGDTTPTATANHNGTDDAAFVLTVTHLDTGRYKVTGTIPSGYAKGDVVNVSVAATVATVAGKAVIDSFVLDSKRVGDLNDLGGTAQSGDVYAIANNGTYGNSAIRTAVNAIPTNPLTTLGTNAPANWINAAAVAASALNGKGDWLLASSYVAPDNADVVSILTSVGAALHTAVAAIPTNPLTTTSDFTAAMKTSLNAATPASVGSVTSMVSANVTAFGGQAVQLDAANLPKVSLDGVVVEAAAGGQAAINGRQALSLVLCAAPAGILTGAGTATITVQNPGATANRVVAQVDTAGNRSSVTLTPPA